MIEGSSDVSLTHSFCGVLTVVGLKQPLNSSTASIILNLPTHIPSHTEVTCTVTVLPLTAHHQLI